MTCILLFIMIILSAEGMGVLFQCYLFLTKLRQHTNDTVLYILQNLFEDNSCSFLFGDC